MSFPRPGSRTHSQAWSLVLDQVDNLLQAAAPLQSDSADRADLALRALNLVAWSEHHCKPFVPSVDGLWRLFDRWSVQQDQAMKMLQEAMEAGVDLQGAKGEA